MSTHSSPGSKTGTLFSISVDRKKPNMEVLGEIFVVPFFGQGHIFPCMELCKHLSSLNYKAILIIPSHLSTSVPSSLRGGRSPLIEIAEIPYSPASRTPEMTAPLPSRPEMPTGSGPGIGLGLGPNPFRMHHDRMGPGLEAFLAGRCKDPIQTRPVCAILDVMMSWSKEFFAKFGIRTVCFFTSSACSFSMQYASWKERVEEMKPGERRTFSGLPAEMELSYSDLQRRLPRFLRKRANNLSAQPMDGPDEVNRSSGGMKIGPPGMKLFPLGPGGRPMWLADMDGSSAVLFNTCDCLEHPFLKYITDQIDKPVYGVGPLLPVQYWKSTGSILHDGQVRSNHESNYSEGQVMQWLDSKPRRSVIYVSFGSELGPTLEECAELADALGELNRPFIWVVQPNAGKDGLPPGLMGGRVGSESKEEGYYPHGLEEKIGDRGLIIKGWAPQLMILSHPALGGFLSHCGWNSTMESIGRGVPILAWPFGVDQFDNAKLVARLLRVGHLLLSDDDADPTQMVKKQNIVRGIESLLDDKDVSKAAEELSHTFANGFPSSSMAALKSFIEVVAIKNP